jgi:hypothetical protein
MSLDGSKTIYRTTAWMGHGDQIYLLFGKRQRAEKPSDAGSLDENKTQRQAEKTLAFHSRSTQKSLPWHEYGPSSFHSFPKISLALTPTALVRELMGGQCFPYPARASRVSHKRGFPLVLKLEGMLWKRIYILVSDVGTITELSCRITHLKFEA